MGAKCLLLLACVSLRYRAGFIVALIRACSWSILRRYYGPKQNRIQTLEFPGQPRLIAMHTIVGPVEGKVLWLIFSRIP